MSKIDALLSNPYHSKCFDHTICLYNQKEKSEQPSLVVGDRVIARNEQLGYYYPGKVSKVYDCVCPLECRCHLLHANIKYDDETRKKNVSAQFIMKFSESSYIIAGDHVMASVLNEYDERCFVPGIVQNINEYSIPKLYTVLYFNGQENYNLRNELIKICKKKYAETTHYIRTKLGIESILRTENIEKPPESPRPDMDAFKNEIVNEIKNQFDSLNLERKYQAMYDEFFKFKGKNQSYNTQLDVNLRTLKKELDDLKYSGPGPIFPNKPNQLPVEPKPKYKPREMSPPSEPTYEQKIILLRQQLPELKRGDEVLAKCPINGWYYRRLIEESIGNYKYRVSFKDSEIIYREDLINIQVNSFQIGDPVVAMHPHHENCYAPGQIITISSDLERYLIRFYDFVESVVHSNDCHQFYKIKFQNDINSISKLDKKFFGKYAVTRNSNTGFYDLGRIVGRASSIVKQQYVLEWSDNTESLESLAMFGPRAQNIPLNVKDYVLALKNNIYFYPGRITHRSGSQIVVEYFNGEIDENINIYECFLITKEHYKLACKHFDLDDNTQNVVELLPEEVRPAELVKERKSADLSSKLKKLPKYEKREVPVIDARQFYTNKNGRVKSVRYESH